MVKQLRHTSLVFAVVALLAAACGAPTTPGASVSPSAGGAASTLVINRDTSDLISLDPAVLYEFSAVFATHNVYETLVRFEGTDLSNIKPGRRNELGHQGHRHAERHHVQAQDRPEVRERQPGHGG